MMASSSRDNELDDTEDFKLTKKQQAAQFGIRVDEAANILGTFSFPGLL